MALFTYVLFVTLIYNLDALLSTGRPPPLSETRWDQLPFDLGVDDAQAGLAVTTLLVLVATLSVAVVANSLFSGDPEADAEAYLWANAISGISRVSAVLALAISLSRWNEPGLLLILFAASLVAVWITAHTRQREEKALSRDMRRVSLLEARERYDSQFERLCGLAAPPSEPLTTRALSRQFLIVLVTGLALALLMWPTGPAAAAIAGNPSPAPDSLPAAIGLLVVPWVLMVVQALLIWLFIDWRVGRIVDDAVLFLLPALTFWPTTLLIAAAVAEQNAVAAIFVIVLPSLVGIRLAVAGARNRGPFRWVFLQTASSTLARGNRINEDESTLLDSSTPELAQ